MTLPIEDYALIGDTHTAALVGRDGSIDWLCVPRFDAQACFAALLGTEEHGRWVIAPAGDVRRTTRRYRGSTLVLETNFETDDGEVRLVDCMPPRRHEADLIRIVEGVRGRVRMDMELLIRFDYGEEGAFLACTCWYADALELMGRHDDACDAFGRVLAIRNDVGLLAEEYDTGRRRMVGNFPQALSHVSLVDTARNLTRDVSGPAEHRRGSSREVRP